MSSSSDISSKHNWYRCFFKLGTRNHSQSVYAQLDALQGSWARQISTLPDGVKDLEVKLLDEQFCTWRKFTFCPFNTQQPEWCLVPSKNWCLPFPYLFLVSSSQDFFPNDDIFRAHGDAKWRKVLDTRYKTQVFGCHLPWFKGSPFKKPPYGKPQLKRRKWSMQCSIVGLMLRVNGDSPPKLGYSKTFTEQI
jgi:hypothetical protein